MPVDFLTADQERSCGRYAGELSRSQLRQYFHLDDRDRGVIDQRREDHTRLGYLAGQLEIADPTCLARYLDRPATRHEHTAVIRAGDVVLRSVPGVWPFPPHARLDEPELP